MATKDRTSLKNDFANGKHATGEKFADLIDSMKVVQLPVVDPQALGTSLSFIDSISQDADGKITATKKTLDLANAHELNPFKGWYKTGDTLPTDGFDGAYLYFKDTSELTGQTTIYRWNGTAYTDTGTVVDTSNVQTFGSGQAVNEVKIKDENGDDVSGPADVLSAEAGANLKENIDDIYSESEEFVSETVVISSGGEITFDTISLNQEGDYIEFELETSLQNTLKGTAFCTYNDDIAIGLINYVCGLRNSSGGNLTDFNFTMSQYNFNTDVGTLAQKGKLKVAFKVEDGDNKVCLYVKGTLVHSLVVTNFPTISINKIGTRTTNGTTYNWVGTIYGFTYHHGSTTIDRLSLLPNYTENEYITRSLVTETVESGELAALKEKVEALEALDLENAVTYTPESREVTESITAQTIGADGFIEKSYVTPTGLISPYNQYDTYWFVADKDMSLWVSDKGSSTTFFRLLVGDGTIGSHTSSGEGDYYSNAVPTTESNAITIAQGKLVAISVVHGVTNFVLSSKFNASVKVIEGYKIPEVEALDGRVGNIENQVGLPLKIVKTSSSEFEIHSTNKEGVTLKYLWKHYQYTKPIGENSADVVCGDIWNQEMIKTEGGTSIIQGNNNFIISVDGTESGLDGNHSAFVNETKTLHAGPGHGCEVQYYTIFLADGKRIDPLTLTEPLYCNVFKEICFSAVYAVDGSYSTGDANNYPKLDSNYNPILSAEHYIDWELSEDNTINEYNRLIVKRDGTVFGLLSAAMLQCYIPYFKDLLINDNDCSWIEVLTPSGSGNVTANVIHGVNFLWNIKKAFKATCIGNSPHNISVTQNIQPLVTDDKTYLNIYTVPYQDRFKCYFQPAKTTVLVSGGTKFNNNEKIEISAYRKIDVSKDE